MQSGCVSSPRAKYLLSGNCIQTGATDFRCPPSRHSTVHLLKHGGLPEIQETPLSSSRTVNCTWALRNMLSAHRAHGTVSGACCSDACAAFYKKQWHTGTHSAQNKKRTCPNNVLRLGTNQGCLLDVYLPCFQKGLKHTKRRGVPGSTLAVISCVHVITTQRSAQSTRGESSPA